MTTDRQPEQTIGFQQNIYGSIGVNHTAGRDLYIDSQPLSTPVLAELQRLKAEIVQARQLGELPEETAQHVQRQLGKAEQQAAAPQPNWQSISEYIITAKTLLDSAESAGKLITGLLHVLQMVQARFV
jgi:hypothetical protein